MLEKMMELDGLCLFIFCFLMRRRLTFIYLLPSSGCLWTPLTSKTLQLEQVDFEQEDDTTSPWSPWLLASRDNYFRHSGIITMLGSGREDLVLRCIVSIEVVIRRHQTDVLVGKMKSFQEIDVHMA